MSSLSDAVAVARFSWRSHYTTGYKSWPVKQLYGLYLLLLDNRDEIVANLAKCKYFTRQILLYC